jgi:YegS/Rv2252/BmrU family lipid kinase
MFPFIVNPAAKSWHSKAYAEKIRQALNDAGIENAFYYTEKPGMTGELAARFVTDGPEAPERLGLIGGDGTLNELVNGLPDGPLPPLFYIPYGSGNDFARGFQLPVTESNGPEMAVKASSLEAQTVDIGQLSINGQAPCRFIVSGGIGFDAAVCFDMLHNSIKKKLNRLHLGFLAYLVLGIKNMFGCPLANGTLIINDGEQTVPLKKLAFMSAHNLPYEGGGFFFGPQASAQDGLIDICAVTAQNHFRFICCLFASLFKGRHVRMKGVYYFRCRKAELTVDKPLDVHTDGEVHEKSTRVCFAVDSAKIRILK